jgi:membrane-associated phospholipid phosphatase
LSTITLERVQPVRTSEPGEIRDRLRAVDWVVGLFFLYAGVLALVLPVSMQVRMMTLAVNAAVICAIPLLTNWPSERRRQIIRDCYPLALVVLAYKQMGWFAPDRHDYRLERIWIRWDDLLLGDWGLKNAVDVFGPVLPTILELSYLLVYLTGPVCLVIIYRYKRKERADEFLLIYVLGLLLSYGQFPFWPSEPPRVVFSESLQPTANIVRDVNLAVVGNAGIRTSVFPSAHVSGVFAAAFALFLLFRDRAWIWRGMTVYAFTVAIATVYGRYHYAVDAGAGVIVAILAVVIAGVIHRGVNYEYIQECSTSAGELPLAS